MAQPPTLSQAQALDAMFRALERIEKHIKGVRRVDVGLGIQIVRDYAFDCLLITERAGNGDALRDVVAFCDRAIAIIEGRASPARSEKTHDGDDYVTE